MKTSLFCLAGILTVIPLVRAGTDAADEASARRVLREELVTAQSWGKVHAADVLATYGEAAAVWPVFLRELKLHPDENQYRVGIHRVLARTAPTSAERAAEVAWIVRVFLDPTSRDRPHAIEALCKLGGPHDVAVISAARRWRAHATDADEVFISWLLWQSGDVSARDFVVSALHSSEAPARLRAAYVLRMIGTKNPAALAALVRAADLEPAGGDPTTRAMLVGAAYQLQASPAQLVGWREILEKMVAEGPPLATYDALQALMPSYGSANLARLRPLLAAPAGDVRIAAAWAILDITTRASAGPTTSR
ncbi:MAG: hypothetical protein ABI222_06010 [Opitutaceae bacterium]